MQTDRDRSRLTITNLQNRLLTENLVSLVEAARSFPTSNGRGIHVGTLGRWRSIGVRGVRLEAVRVGGRWMTSWQALDRFVTCLNATRQASPPSETSSRRLPANVERQLDAEGL